MSRIYSEARHGGAKSEVIEKRPSRTCFDKLRCQAPASFPPENGPAKIGRIGKMETRIVARDARPSWRYLLRIRGRGFVPAWQWLPGTRQDCQANQEDPDG